jgi:hypothetical protein
VVFVTGPTAQVVRSYFNQPGSSGAPDDAMFKRLAKELGENRDYVKAHEK